MNETRNSKISSKISPSDLRNVSSQQQQALLYAALQHQQRMQAMMQSQAEGYGRAAEFYQGTMDAGVFESRKAARDTSSNGHVSPPKAILPNQLRHQSRIMDAQSRMRHLYASFDAQSRMNLPPIYSQATVKYDESLEGLHSSTMKVPGQYPVTSLHPPLPQEQLTAFQMIDQFKTSYTQMLARSQDQNISSQRNLRDGMNEVVYEQEASPTGPPNQPTTPRSRSPIADLLSLARSPHPGGGPELRQSATRPLSPFADMSVGLVPPASDTPRATGPLVGIGIAAQHYSGEENKFVVSAIKPGEAAARDGSIRPGDRIVAVDGRLASDWTAETLQETILGVAGSKCSVTFARALSEEIDKEWEVTLIRGGVDEWAAIDELDFMKAEIPKWNAVLRRETDARVASERQSAQLTDTLQQKNQLIGVLIEQQNRDAHLIEELIEQQKRDAHVIRQLQAQLSRAGGLASNVTLQATMLAMGASWEIIVLQGPRSGRGVSRICAQQALPRRLPEGPYAFENLSRLAGRLALIPDGQVDGVGKASAALQAGAKAVILMLPSIFALPAPSLDKDLKDRISIPVMLCNNEDCQQLDGCILSIARRSRDSDRRNRDTEPAELSPAY